MSSLPYFGADPIEKGSAVFKADPVPRAKRGRNDKIRFLHGCRGQPLSLIGSEVLSKARQLSQLEVHPRARVVPQTWWFFSLISYSENWNRNPRYLPTSVSPLDTAL